MPLRWLVRALAALCLLACGGDPAPAATVVPKPALPLDELACVQIVLFQHNGGQPCADCVETLPAEAERQALAAQAQLDRGADFAALARTLGSAHFGPGDNGELGTFRRSKWPSEVAAIRDAVFALKIGAHASKPLPIEYGFVLVRRCATGTPKDTPADQSP